VIASYQFDNHDLEQTMLDRPFPAAAEGLPKFSERDLAHEEHGPTTQAMASILEDGLEAGNDALTILALCHASMAYDPTDSGGQHPDLADDIGPPGSVRTCGISLGDGRDIESAIVRLPATDAQPYRFKVFSDRAQADALARRLCHAGV
jgi:hypothetical protein